MYCKKKEMKEKSYNIKRPTTTKIVYVMAKMLLQNVVRTLLTSNEAVLSVVRKTKN